LDEIESIIGVGYKPPRQAVETVVMNIEQGSQSLDWGARNYNWKGTSHALFVHILLNARGPDYVGLFQQEFQVSICARMVL
jgi:hypothetical protein